MSGAFSFDRPEDAAEGQRLTFSVVDSLGNNCVQQRVFGPLDPVQKQEITLDTPTATFGRNQSLSLSGACAEGATVNVTALYEDGTSEEFTAAVNGGRYSLVRAMEPAFSGRRDQIIRLMPHYADEDYGPVARVQYKYTALLSLTGDLVASRTVQGISESNRTLTFSIPSIGYNVNAYTSVSGRFQVTCPIEALEGADAVLSFTDAYTNPGTLSLKVKDPDPITLGPLPEGPCGADKWLSFQGTREQGQSVYVTYGLPGGTLTKAEAYYPEEGRWAYGGKTSTLSGIDAPATGQVQISFAYKGRTGQPIYLDYDFLIGLDLPAYVMQHEPITGVTDPDATVQLYYSSTYQPDMTTVADASGAFSFDTTNMSTWSVSTVRIVATDGIQNTLTKSVLYYNPDYLAVEKYTSPLYIYGRRQTMKIAGYCAPGRTPLITAYFDDGTSRDYQTTISGTIGNNWSFSGVMDDLFSDHRDEGIWICARYAGDDSRAKQYHVTYKYTVRMEAPEFVYPEIELVGTAEAGCTVKLEVPEAHYSWETTTNSSGVFSITCSSYYDVADGMSVVFTAKDAYGNETQYPSTIRIPAATFDIPPKSVYKYNEMVAIRGTTVSDTLPLVRVYEKYAFEHWGSPKVYITPLKDGLGRWKWSGRAELLVGAETTQDTDFVIILTYGGKTTVVRADFSYDTNVPLAVPEEVVVGQSIAGKSTSGASVTGYCGASTLLLTTAVQTDGSFVFAFPDGCGVGATITIRATYQNRIKEKTIRIVNLVVTLDKTSATLYTGETLILHATVLPNNISNPGVSWSSTDETVATVVDGIVTALKAGSATITATTADSSSKSATCAVTVRQYANGMALDKTSATLYTGETLTLTPTVFPSDASDKDVTWASSNETVATVANGVVTARKSGSATITATAADGSDKYATCQITVKQYATGVSVDKSSATVYVGGTLTLQATVTPGDTSDKRVTWASSDTAIATVSSSGVVTGVKAGSATINATTADGSNKSASCQITVKQYATGVALSKTSAALYAGETLTLTPTVSPSDASDKGVTWASSSETVATVANGVVTARKSGSATITATAADGSGKSASCQITVKQYATGVALDKTSATLYTGESMTLQATVSPSDASDKGVTWASSDTAIATVSASGVVTAHKAGSAAITATTADGGKKSVSCQITVWTPASGVIVGPVAEAMLKPGDMLTLSADVQPADAHDRGVTWSTSSASVARVQGGAVTPVARGMATITATTHNGKTATCAITVEDRIVDLELRVPPETPITDGVYGLRVGATLKIGTVVQPLGIGHTLSYKSSNEKVASVKSGVVTALKNGQATITITAKDSKGLSSKSKTLKVSAFTPVGNVSLPGEAQILTGKAKKLTATIAPTSASDRTLTWASGDEAVATVAQDGTVTAKKAGTVTITATSSNSKVGSCLVRVTDRATGILITTATGLEYMDYKADMLLTAAVSPGTAYENVTWKSTDTDYVTVDKNGKVYGRKVGKATIYAKATDGTYVRGSITIRVITPMKGVKLAETEKIFIGKTKKLSASLTPSGATFKTLTWRSDNEAVATVAADGTVTAKALGTAVITATAYNGLADSCTITVAQPVTGITLAPANGYTVVYKGETTQPLKFDITPGNANSKDVTWKSSNEKYARVNEKGEVTGRNPGKVKITATAKDGSGAVGSIKLTIASPATSIRLNKSGAVLYHNGATDALKTVRLTAAASPKGSVYRSLTWSVISGADVATVDETTGLVTALKHGTAVVRAETDRGYADCTVTVRTLPTTFSLNTTERTLAFKQSFDLGAEAVFDAGCTEKALTWTSKNKNVATVSSTGIVKASKNRTGTTTITATTKNGFKATCAVKVVKSLPKGATGTPAAEAAAPRIALKLTGGGYASSDGRVADVDGKGNVELKADGAATLEAGGRQIGVKVEGGNLAELKLDESCELLLISGADALWAVQHGEIAAVDGEGRLTALRKGTTTLTCRASDGGEWTVRIVVTRPEGDESQQNPEPLAEPEPAVSTEPTVTPEPSPEPTAVPEPDPSVEPEPTATPESDPSVEPEPTAAPEPDPSVEPEPTAAPEPEPSVKPEPTGKPEPEKAPDPEPIGNPAGTGGQAEADVAGQGLAHRGTYLTRPCRCRDHL